MPSIGFLCPIDGAEHVFSDCLKCARHCLPLPLLLVLSKADRVKEPGIYHCTEILNPPKVVYFERHYDYFQDPLDMAYATFGTAFHSIMEEGAALVKEMGLCPDKFRVEEPFTAELDTPAGRATLRGRPDIYDTELKTLYDYKTEKSYSVKLLKEGNFNDSKHMAQLNIYRLFKYPEAEHLVIVAMVKDHGRQIALKDGLRPIELIELPILNDKAVRDYVIYRVAENLRTEADPQKVRDCTEEELWLQKKDGMPLRCTEYCPAGKSGLCLQGSQLIKEYQSRVKHERKPSRPR